MKNKGKIYMNPEIIDSRYSSAQEQLTEGALLMKMRKEKMAKLSEEEIFKAKLLQLKLQMEEFIKAPEVDIPGFTTFLKSYIDTLYKKRKDFADDIAISERGLSKIVNHHVEPNRDFMFKLMVHSIRAFTFLHSFKERIWYEIYYKDKISQTMANRDTWRQEVEKNIKFESLT